jgi:hypothetical protein
VAIGCACSACFSADHIESGSTLCVIHTRCNDGSHTQRSMTSPLLTMQLVTMVQLRSTSHHRHSPLAARRRGSITLAIDEMTCVLQGATSARHIYEHLRSHTAQKVWMSYLSVHGIAAAAFHWVTFPRLLLFRWVARPAAPPAEECMLIPLELYHAHFAGDRLKARC